MRIDSETLLRWQTMAQEYLTVRDRARLSVFTGVDAWNIAHNCGITREAYADRSIVDAHIQTALESIFPNAVFKDRKVY